MSDRLLRPDISDCATQQETAAWLLACPLATLVTEEAFIRRTLRLSGFREGLSYLETMLSVLREDRREDGNLMNYMAFATANGRLWRVADGLPPR
ncbi:hypothetical protein [Neorhizobium petrolearium]|uniref:Uncharacterized protein n=1 Tax=Neorhizobium petrolearium TaxID=515361 RepID=A0ABY8M2C5_9HYPH|nr:hypothetical protein [Neorhizobium petrolearium]MCC2608373.1 hypothetical protein [Neorhizobium petrolearium]WGI68652.1 hypothetical protein QEO92_00695 [Neorhizobium petrolearium]